MDYNALFVSINVSLRYCIAKYWSSLSFENKVESRCEQKKCLLFSEHVKLSEESFKVFIIVKLASSYIVLNTC